ncbi:Na+/H antiporter NhaA [Escherichia coli]|uniref:Na+/H antiporter NhaA n=1 Tax=Escherichia coli TaxID=562 RepID=A0A377F4Y0_ECOLX|nr:Na+/H antiporter NhaA [Escherichia coli]
MFLLAVAIIDDLGVVVIIALFYTGDLSTMALLVGFIMTGVLFMLNAKEVTKTYAIHDRRCDLMVRGA